MPNLKDKVVIVTGAGGGIGQASALVLAAAGARLVLTDVDADSGEAAVRAVKDAAGDAVFVKADIGAPDQVRDLVDRTVKHYGRLNGAFNNAGLEQRAKPLVDLTLEDWDAAMRVDLSSMFYCLKFQIPAILASGGGAIVNTASALGQVAIPNCAEYVTAKHGVIGLTRAAAVDYGRQGVRVNAVLPGVTRTPMMARMMDNPAFTPMFDAIRARHPMGRLAETHEIGAATAWLLSDEASFVNGAAIAVDGGYTAN